MDLSSSSTVDSILIQSLPFSTHFQGVTDIWDQFSSHTTSTSVNDASSVEKTSEATAAEKRSKKESQKQVNGLKYTNSFRGRTLLGRKLMLPSPFIIGLVVKEKTHDHVEILENEQNYPKRFRLETTENISIENGKEEDRSIASNSFILWSHDLSTEEPIPLCQWIDLAREIHGE